MFINPSEIVTASDKKELASAIEKNKNIVKERLKKQNMSKIYLLTENPGTQLTISFNPVFKDAKEWYGIYFKE